VEVCVARRFSGGSLARWRSLTPVSLDHDLRAVMVRSLECFATLGSSREAEARSFIASHLGRRSEKWNVRPCGLRARESGGKAKLTFERVKSYPEHLLIDRLGLLRDRSPATTASESIGPLFIQTIRADSRARVRLLNIADLARRRTRLSYAHRPLHGR
jgi:hypothetical protein